MRTIKFRAWNTKGLSMSPPNSLAGWIMVMGVMGIDLDQQPWEIMQFTGLLDKNGKEIYEGDIVKHNRFGVKGDNDIIQYDSESASFLITNGPRRLILRTDSDCAVIGNIYENPELLQAV